MKKFLSLLLMITMVISVAGCVNNAKDNAKPLKNTEEKAEEREKKATETDANKKAEEQAKKEAEEKNTEVESSTVSAENTFETDNGIIRVLGVEKANPEFLKGVIEVQPELQDEENIYIVKFEVTNKGDQPKDSGDIFRCEIYQNNVEVEPVGSYVNYGGGQYDLIENDYKGIMTGGTLIFGRPVILEDKSELTIFVKDDLNRDNKTSFTINVE